MGSILLTPMPPSQRTGMTRWMVNGSQGRLITLIIRVPGSTPRLITLTTTLLMPRELPNDPAAAKKAGEDLWAVTKEAEKKMKDEQDEEERKKADEEAKKDEDDEDADDLDADEEDDIPEDDDEEADEPEHDEL